MLKLNCFKTMRKELIETSGFAYKHFIKKILFLTKPEAVHEFMTNFGEMLGKARPISKSLEFITKVESPMLEQTLFNIKFKNPVGLAAGFDYEARLTKILPSIGFGSETVGTITNSPYEGNPKPMLGRLPKSKSLMVNKGFKNLGATETIKKLKGHSFDIPIGISIGRSNNQECDTQEKSIEDIIKTFELFEESNVNHSYYELNISCPNLSGNVSFYPPRSLRELLLEVDKLHLKKPVFVKMPLEKSDNEVLEMLNVITSYSPKGVIFSNLSKNRNNKFLITGEVNKFPAGVGSFSGKPTEKRSNELVKLAYKNFGKSLLIIGCGGIFNAEDAYTKIKLGASLVQLITGMIFEGPFLPAQINNELIELLKKDGLKNISEAVGVNTD
jgi:dihydroorotate dehydrogenase